MKRYLTKSQQRLLAVAIFLSIICFLYYLVIRPMNEKISSIEEETERKYGQLEKNLALIDKSSNLADSYQTYLDHLKQTKSNDEVMSSILLEIEEVARKLNLPISDLKPKRVREEEFYNRFSVSLTIDSEFVDVIHFLYLLQDQPHLFEVEELRFDKSSRRKSTVVKTSLVLSKILVL